MVKYIYLESPPFFAYFMFLQRSNQIVFCFNALIIYLHGFLHLNCFYSGIINCKRYNKFGEFIAYLLKEWLMVATANNKL